MAGMSEQSLQGPAVRVVRPEDLPRVVELMREHIAYEKSDLRPEGLAERLHPLLFGPDRQARLWILVAADPAGQLVGYAACATEFAFWEARDYLHMDCLYLAEGARGHGLGTLLMSAVSDLARDLDLAEVQWQTPDWNEGAIRFYDRLGAGAKAKRRYSLPVPGLTR